MLALLASAALCTPPQVEVLEHTAYTADGVHYVQGQLLVGWEEGVPRADREAAIQSLGGTLGQRFGGRLSHVVHLPEGAEAEAEAARYAALPNVRYAELNGIGGVTTCASLTADPRFADQWYLENTSSNPGTPGADIDAVSAWATTTGDASVVLAVIDTGINEQHPEFAGRLLPGIDTVDGDNVPDEQFLHGTSVAGLAAANANNVIAMAGVDHHCSIIPIKVIPGNGIGTIPWLVDGIDFAVQNGADVINMSLGNYPPDQALQDALGDARAAGVILISSAGNGGTGNADVSWPGASPDTISIAVTDSNDVRPSYSGTGNALDFAAPGHDALSITPTGYTLFGGTSAAAPIVAGTVCLLLSIEPTLTQDEVYDLLLLGAEDQVGPANWDTPGRDNFYGHGRINAAQSIAAISQPLNYCNAIPNSTGAASQLTLAGSNVIADDDFRLVCTSLPPFVTSMVVLGTERADGLVPSPSVGRLCVGGTIGRVIASIQTSDASGTISHTLDLSALPLPGNPAAVAGERWRFQVWHRDTLLIASTSNLSNGLDVPLK